MIKLILILITLTAFARPSYAFFPVLVSHQTEVVDTFISANGSESFSYTVLGFFIGFFSWVLFLLPLFLLLMPNKSF
tara:strand:+ start:789 stop:1019 length:231 start_codon:yes stop_codon:yes gene_type:complete